MLRAALGCALLGACSFSPGMLASDGGTTSGDADGSVANSDGDADAPMIDAVHVRPITIAGTVTDGPHDNFVVLVSLQESWLAHTTFGGKVTSVDAFDVVFSADAAGTIPLAHEQAGYNQMTGRYRAWVELPALAQTTVFYIRYGDPEITTTREDIAAVWNPSYAAVWHLEGSLADSAGTAAGTNAGSVEVNGKIGGARSFDGVDDAIDLTSATAIDNLFIGGGTIEAWFLATSFGENVRGRLFEKSAFTTGGGIDGWALHLDDGNVNESIRFAHSTTTGIAVWNTGSGTITTGTWHHVAVTYDKDNSANTPLVIVDGVEMALTGSTPGGTVHADDGHTLRLGNRANLDRTFHGALDEARLSTTGRSRGWLQTSFANQNDADAYCVAGAELGVP